MIQISQLAGNVASRALGEGQFCACALLTSLGIHIRRLLLYVPVGKFCELRTENIL